MTSSEHSPNINIQLPKGYHTLSFISKGATSAVYRIKEEETEVTYACKVSTQKEILEKESCLMQELDHPIYPKWHDFWQDGEFAYLVMEYVNGITLENLLKQRICFPQAEVVRIGIELADGLAYLHERNPPVLHRDLKPANIMIQQDGKVRVIDLGAAYRQMQSLAGTPGYAAPEQFHENGATVKSDIYSWGKVIHYMLTGKDPCLPPYSTQTIRVYNRKLWRGLEQIVENCLVLQLSQRIPGMRELIRRLALYHCRSRWEIFFAETRMLWKAKREPDCYYEKNVWKSSYKN